MHRSQHCFLCILRENSNEFVSFAHAIFEGMIVTKTTALVSKVSSESCVKEGSCLALNRDSKSVQKFGSTSRDSFTQQTLIFKLQF